LNNVWLLLLIFCIAIFTKNNILASAAGIVLILGLMNLQRLYPFLERRGLEMGILFLTIPILIPFATGQVKTSDILKVLTSPIGLLAIIGGLLGAYLNDQGLTLLQLSPEIIPGIIIGVVICVSLFGGVSVGPVMAAGITAVLVTLFNLLFSR